MNVTGIVFTNDASLGELTTKRTMASLPFGGRYRQVDWALSNLACAGVRHIGIISRHNFQSLMNHIGDGEEWGLELEEGGLEFLTLCPVRSPPLPGQAGVSRQRHGLPRLRL